MSQFPSLPPPGPYVPPNNQSQQLQGSSQQQQPHYGYQQPQAPSPYKAHAQDYNQPASQKPTKAFGQVFNQAVTQGKPMLDKLGKFISSKHSKPVYNPQSAPQENYQSYQQQHQQYGQPQVQQYQQAQPQGHPNQGQQFNPRPQSVYQTPLQSPFPQSAYGTPASGNLGQGNNYLPPQALPTPQQHAPQYQQAPQQASYQQSNSSSHNNPGEQAHGHSQPPGQPGQGQVSQVHAQGVPPQTAYGQAQGQQTGIIGGTQIQPPQNFQQHGPPANVFPPEKQPQQHQWGAPASVNQHHASSTPQSPAPSLGGQQQQQWAPHQQASPAAQSPVHLQPTPSPQQQNAAPPAPVHPNQQQAQQSPQAQHQQWAPMPPVSPQAQQVHQSPGANSPAPQTSEIHKPASPAPATLPQHQSQVEPSQQKSAQLPAAASQKGPSNAGPMGFIAELPAELGSMSPVEGAKTEQVSSNASQAAPYRAYKPGPGQNGSPGPGYTIARRAVSTSSLPLADPWRFADPVTEVPTREFYIIADLVFDSIDRMFEPQNTGMLEANKVLESWKAQQLPDEAADLFAHDCYSAFGKMWSLEGVPHVMVPSQPSLMPTWNFQQQIHSEELKLPDESTSVSTYPTYVPALNRAGWYKYSFLNWLHQPEDVEKMLSAFCADTYKPGILNQPDMQKRDKNESPALVSRATRISTTAVSRVCQEVVAQMQGSARDGRQGGGLRDATQGAPQAQHSGDVSDPDASLKMHSLQIQQQFNAMMHHSTPSGSA
ncbi:hypothetical protein PSPO01_01656 [Paraphaeosphaeria sporulosa]